MTFNNEFPIIKLFNGLNVMNFSSPHSYVFVTREVLPACSDEVAQKYKLDSDHTLHDRGTYSDVLIKYNISNEMCDVLVKASEYNGIDIILVPYPVLDAWSTMVRNLDHNGNSNGIRLELLEQVLLKIRTCKLDDRVTKVIKSDQFCTSLEGLMVINEDLKHTRVKVTIDPRKLEHLHE